MALWFLRGLRRGVVTTRYPSRADPSAVYLPTPPVFDAGRLTVELGDRLVRACPSGAIDRQGNVLILDVGACNGCGRCIQIGEQAVRPSGEFELAATSRDHLVKRIPIGGG